MMTSPRFGAGDVEGPVWEGRCQCPGIKNTCEGRHAIFMSSQMNRIGD